MIKNIFANFLGRLWSILSGFIFIPLYIYYLGFESYSIISFTLLISGLMAILDSGLSATLSREFSRLDISIEEKNRTFITLETTYFFIVGFCITLLILNSEFIAVKWINSKEFDSNELSYFINIISIDISFQLLLRFYMGGLFGLEKQVKANYYQVGWGILRNGLVLIAIMVIPKLEIFFIWQTCATIIFTILLRLSLVKFLRGQGVFKFNLIIEGVILNRIWKFAFGMLLISLVSGINTQMDKIAISQLLPIENLGYYTLAVSLSMGLVTIITPISIATLPRFTSLYSEGKYILASQLFKKVNLYAAILIFSTMANLVFFSKELIWIWTGNLELATKAGEYLPIISIATAFLSLAMIPYNVAIANGYTKLNNLLGLFSLLLTLPGYWLATKQFGARGAAFVFCGVQTTMTLLYFYFIIKKFIKIKAISNFFISQIFFPFILSLIIAFGFAFSTNLLLGSRMISMILIGVSTIFTIVISTRVLLGKREVNKIINFIVLFLKLKFK
jgi:O-antigen/teichoic acid export membrane protein